MSDLTKADVITVIACIAAGAAVSLAAVVVILLWAKVIATVATFVWGLW